MEKQFRKTYADINLRHVRHNIQQLRSLVAGAKFFCPMVKANAYGHGDIKIALALQEAGVTQLGVGLVEEGINLRLNSVTSEIFFFGMFDHQALKAIFEYKLTPVISSLDQLAILKENLGTVPIDIHLKFDTGMHRLGFGRDDIFTVADQLKNEPQIRVVGLMTHLLRGEDIEDQAGDSRRQIKDFTKILAANYWPKAHAHVLNSAGLLGAHRINEASLSSLGARPGLMVYGLSPLPLRDSDPQLLPVMSLRSTLIRVHRLKKGQTVSYGGTWSAPTDSVIGVLPIGYADGYHRILSNRSEVLVAGLRAPVVGNVCMDYLMVDLTNVCSRLQISADDLIGREVTLFGFDRDGNEISASELAQKAGTIAWEILTSVGERVPRSYNYEESKKWNQVKTEVLA